MNSQNKKIIFLLPYFAVSFSLGILAASLANIPFFICYLLAVLLFITCLFLRGDEALGINLLGLVFFLGAAHMSGYQIFPKNHINNYKVLFWADSYRVKGAVESEPEINKGRTKFTFKVLEIDDEKHKQKVTGKILVTDLGKHGILYGDELILEGQFFKSRNFGKGSFNYKQYLTRKGIYGLLNVKKDAFFKIIAHNKANSLKYLAVKLKQKIQQGFKDNLPQAQASVLSAMLLGDRADLPKGVREVFIRTGTAHILAISGLHVGIIAFIVLVFLKAIGIRKRPRYLLSIGFLLFYCLLAGARPSVVRAVIMAITVLFGLFLEKDTNIYNSLSLAGIAILAYNPFSLFDAGFQLSFISVASIVYLSPKIDKLLRLDNFIPKFGFIIRPFSVSLSAWLGTFSLIIYYFKIISPITILANLVIVPLVSVLAVAGFILILSIFFVPALTHVFALTAGAIVFLLIKSAQIFSLIPGAYFYLPR